MATELILGTDYKLKYISFTNNGDGTQTWKYFTEEGTIYPPKPKPRTFLLTMQLCYEYNMDDVVVITNKGIKTSKDNINHTITWSWVGEGQAKDTEIGFTIPIQASLNEDPGIAVSYSGTSEESGNINGPKCRVIPPVRGIDYTIFKDIDLTL